MSKISRGVRIKGITMTVFAGFNPPGKKKRLSERSTPAQASLNRHNLITSMRRAISIWVRKTSMMDERPGKKKPKQELEPKWLIITHLSEGMLEQPGK